MGLMLRSSGSISNSSLVYLTLLLQNETSYSDENNEQPLFFEEMCLAIDLHALV
jgi:hypothetical protein